MGDVIDMVHVVITYMFMFLIGLSLVVAVNETFSDLSDNISEEGLEQGLGKIANSVADSVYNLYVLGSHSQGSDGSVLAQFKIDLPNYLYGERIFVNFALVDGNVEVLAFTNKTISLSVSALLTGISVSSIDFEGELSSELPNHYIKYIENGSVDIIRLVSSL